MTILSFFFLPLDPWHLLRLIVLLQTLTDLTGSGINSVDGLEPASGFVQSQPQVNMYALLLMLPFGLVFLH